MTQQTQQTQDQIQPLNRFADLTGDSWLIELHYGLIRTIRQQCGVDLLAVFDGDTLTSLGDDPDKLISVIWHCCQQQAEEKALDLQGFYNRFDDAVFYAALSALLEGITFFFREEKRPALRAVIASLKEMDHTILDTLSEKETLRQFQEAAGKAAKLEAAQLRRKLSGASGNGPDGSD